MLPTKLWASNNCLCMSLAQKGFGVGCLIYIDFVPLGVLIFSPTEAGPSISPQQRTMRSSAQELFFCNKPSA